MSRSLRVAAYVGIGIVAGLAVAVLVISLATRSEWGMERARRYIVGWLDDRVHGELRLGRITGPGLLGGAVIHDFGIIDASGRPFLSTDSLELAYDWRTLLRGRIVLNRVVLYRPNVVLEKLPGDTAWNYEYVFQDTTPDGPPGERNLIMFEGARIINGTAIVRRPIDLDDSTQPADTARMIIDAMPGGFGRTMLFDSIDARLDRVIWESPIEPGRLFDVRSLSARGHVWRDPFHVSDARGTLTMRDSIVTFDMPEVELPGSRAAILGRVITGRDRNIMDIRVDGDRLQFRDLQWLYPALPDEGGGSVVLRIQSQPDGTLFLAEDARITAPGTRLAGSFGVVAGGDSIYFTQVNLRASPLDVRLIEQILPGGLPVDGLLVGTVEVSGPLSALETTGDMQYAARGAVSADSTIASGATGADISWRGVLDVRNTRAGRLSARSFSADVRRLELAMLSALDASLKLEGSVAGRVDASGRLDLLTFTTSFEHWSGAGGRSAFAGGGTLSGRGTDRAFDVHMDAVPATLQELAHYVPALRGLDGEVTGPVHLSGTSDDLGFSAQLTSPAGPLELDGQVVRTAGGRRVTATAYVDNFALHRLRTAWPSSRVSGSLEVDITGDDFASAAGSLVLLLDSARLGSMPNANAEVYGTLGDGMLTVDSSLVRSVLGVARGSGGIALSAERDGRLDIAFSSESLVPLESYVFGDVADLDADPRIAGRVEGQATLAGRPGLLQLTTTARADDVVFGPIRAARVQVDGGIDDVGTIDSRLHLATHGDSITAWLHAVHTASLELSGRTDSLGATISAGNVGGETFRALAAVRRADDGPIRLRLDELRIGGASPWLLAAPAAVALDDAVAQLDTFTLRHQSGARIVAAGRLGWADTVSSAAPTSPSLDFGVRLSGVPFDELLRAVRSTESGAGNVEGTLRVYGTALDPIIDGELSAHDVLYGDVRIDRAFAEVSYASLGMDAHAEAQYGGRSILTGGGRIPLDLRLTPVAERRTTEPLRVTLSADSLPLTLPLGVLDGFTNVEGRIDGRLTLGGTSLDPSLGGGFAIRGGTADWNVSGVRYRDVNGSLTLEGDRLLRIDLTAFAGDARSRGARLTGTSGGSGTIQGTLDFAQLGDPRFDLRFTADRAYAARRRDVEASVTGTILLGGQYSRPEITGSVRVDESTLYLDELYRQYLIVGLELDDLSLLTLVDTSLVAVRPLLAASTNPFLRGLYVRNLQVAVASDSWLRSRDMDVGVTGNLTVAFDRRHEDLKLSGSLNVERGTYTLYYPPLQSRRFQVRDGTIDFPGTPGIDPNLRITAAYRARAQGEPLDVLAVVGGTLQNPRVRLSSDAQPPISESDLASYLFFGVPTWKVANTDGGGGDVRAITGLGARALGPSVLGYASSGLQTLVQGAGIVDFVGLSAADVASTEQHGSGLGRMLAGTQLELGKYLSSNLFLGYSQRLGSETYDPAVRLEWRFLPEHTFELFTEDRLARTPGFGARTETGLRKVYGFLLFREWGF